MTKAPRADSLPTITALTTVVLTLLRERTARRATNSEILDEVIRRLALSDEDVARVHDRSRGRRTELEYRLAWARTQLRRRGLIESAGRRVWMLSATTDSDAGSAV